MSVQKSWWRRLVGVTPAGYLRALEFLRTRYVEERQQAKRLAEQAAKMQYPQFREKLLNIAADETKHANWIADKINLLGGKLPEVPEVSIGEKTVGVTSSRILRRKDAVAMICLIRYSGSSRSSQPLRSCCRESTPMKPSTGLSYERC